MTKKELIFAIKATDDTSSVTSKIAGNAAKDFAKVEAAIDDTRSAGQRMADDLIAEAARLEVELSLVERGAKALGDALGPELAAEAEPHLAGMVLDLRRAGLTIEDIEASADQLALGMKRVGEASDHATQVIGRGFDNVSRAGDQSRSVMANMAGNAASELPGIATALGPVNVALGQLAEYAADGNIRLKNLAALGGGMLAVGLILKGVTDSFARAEASKAFDRDRVKAFATAIRESGDASEVLRKELEETGKVLVEIGSFGNIDILPALAELGMTVEDFTRLAGRSTEEIDAWSTAMHTAGADAGSVSAVTLGLIDTHENLADAQRTAAVTAEVLGENQADLGEITAGVAGDMDELTRAIEDQNDAKLAGVDNALALQSAMVDTARELQSYQETMESGTATELDRIDAGNQLVQQFFDEAEAAGRSAHDQAVAAGNAAGAQEAATQAQIDALNRLGQNLDDDSPLRAVLYSHITALRSIPTNIETRVRVTTTARNQGLADYFAAGGYDFTERSHGGGVPPGGAVVHDGEIVEDTPHGVRITDPVRSRSRLLERGAGGNGGDAGIHVSITGVREAEVARILLSELTFARMAGT